MSNFVLVSNALIINNKEEVLLQLRNNTKMFAHMWSTPGGKVDLGESLEDALIREVKEEHGVVVSIIRFLQLYENIQPDRHSIYFAYLVKITKGTPKILEPDECSDLKWFPLHSLPKPITPQVRKYIQTYLASKKPL